MSVIINVDKKVLPYRIRRAMPILGLAIASLLPCACSKDKELVNPEKPVAPVDTVDNRYDVTVKWGWGIASADASNEITTYITDPNVRNIILESNGHDWAGTASCGDIMEKKINPMLNAAANSKEKLIHCGNIYRPLMRNKTQEEYIQSQKDSTILANLGYKILSPIYTLR